mgnify:CR=1 FL=1
MTNEYRKSADLCEGNFFAVMSALANTRLSSLCSEWRSKYPKSSLKIIFGNGSEHVAVNGITVYFWSDQDEYLLGEMDLHIVLDALKDVWYICDNYSRARPNDIEVLPDDSELGGKDEQEGDSRNFGEDIRAYEKFPSYRCPRPGAPGDAVYI